MNDASPETFGRFLRTHARYAKKTCERKGQVSRIDAVCWYLAQVTHASSRDVKRFMTAFKGKGHTYRRYVPNPAYVKGGEQPRFLTKTWEGPEPAYSMLNAAYGGVGYGFEGRVSPCMTGTHYGPVAPLYRPLPRTYAITVGGIARARRVQDYIDACQA